MKNNMGKALICAVIGYLIAVGFCFGMLKTAQRTRKRLYGGRPVMAQVTKELPDSSTQSGSLAVSFGGGEWQIRLPSGADYSHLTAHIPPCGAVWLLRLHDLAVTLSDQTAEGIRTASSGFASR